MHAPSDEHDDDSQRLWREVEASVALLAAAAREDRTDADFFGLLLTQAATLTGAAGGVVWKIAKGATTAPAAQQHLDRVLAGSAAELARHRGLAEQIAVSGGQIIPPAYSDGVVSNATPWLIVAHPARAQGKTLAVVELFQPAGDRAEEGAGYLRLVEILCELVERRDDALRARRAEAGERHLRNLLEIAQAASKCDNLRGAALALANETRRLLAFDRVSVLISSGGRMRLEAVSGVASIDRRSVTAAALEALAGFVAATREPLWRPEPATNDESNADAEDDPEALVRLLDAASAETHAQAVGVVPLPADDQTEGRLSGVIILERFAGEFTHEEAQQLAVLAPLAGAVLARALDYHQLPLRGLLAPLGRGWQAVSARGWRVLVVLGLLAAAVVALCLIPADLTISARGELRPEQRRHLFAPADGVVSELLQADDQRVAQGELLVRLVSPELELRFRELDGRRKTAFESLQASETTALRSEQGGSSAEAVKAEAAARALVLKQELVSLDKQLEVIRQEQAALDVCSPLAGVILNWDSAARLSGRPVRRGDVLLTVANPAGGWELALETEDAEFPFAQRASANSNSEPNVRFQFSTAPGISRSAVVTQIANATVLSSEGYPVVRITARPSETATADFRPGAAVTAQIRCGRCSLGYAWTRRLWSAVRQQFAW